MISTAKLFRIIAAAAKVADKHSLAIPDDVDPARAITALHDQLHERAASYRADIKELARLSQELDDDLAASGAAVSNWSAAHDAA